MVDNDYTLEGRFKIANENMKQEMNELIIQILYKTGIRKTTTVMINGREFDAVEQTYPDENGIIYFDYSVFEKRIRRGNYYNCHTCELVTEDRGENEFGLVMNMIMIILESCSDSPCYLMHKGNLFNILGYVDLVESLTGKVLNFKNRDNIGKIKGIPVDRHLLYKCILRDDEDELLGFWDSETILLSDQRKEEISEWSDRYKSLKDDDVKSFDMEAVLAKAIAIMSLEWECRYVNKDMVDEFIGNKEVSSYKKAVYLLQKLLEEDMEMFGEFTKTQVLEWILYEIDPEEKESSYSAYMSLLGNKKYRKEFMGF